MAAFTFNTAKGKAAYYAGLPAANDAVVAVLLVAAGLEADGALRDHDTLAAILAATNDEATFAGYARQTVTGITVTVDDAGDTVTVDFDTVSWSPTSGQSLGKVVFAYDPDTTGGTDADLIPLWADDYVLDTPSSGSISYVPHADGLYEVT